MKFDEPMPNHRKIHYYYPIRLTARDSNGKILEVVSDRQDVVDGHGTHVTGSVLGDIPKSHPNYDALKKYGGVAPDAKMFFTDIQNPMYPGLLLPGDLSTYFKKPFENGARIHSNSWGLSIVEVSCLSNCECYWNPGNSFNYPAYSRASDSVCKKVIGRRCCEWATVYD
eukprot:CAMPEP_0117428036 /NCGR_PEP_ID=MMETSP0758-20121206/7821_1 /TAXON_ID=63605 /ORGANISM="Percolomonas cosmopolitus, Strain AE-1 (ATCC 50343)" /LENGTH=168 /DNA_ID=CAMNT_0005214145 /DNA_START=1031 /DNA_END=1534 /DNA_ORIENTATION=-